MRAIGALIGLGAVAALIAAGGYSFSADEAQSPAVEGWSFSADKAQSPASQLCDIGPCEHATVNRVIDGDTVDVDISGETRRVRVLGIDTPETKKRGAPVECFGPEATARAETLLPPGSTVTVVTDNGADTNDKYGRDLRHIATAGGDNVGQLLVSEGYAETMTFPHSLADSYGAAETAARDQRHGLWGACG